MFKSVPSSKYSVKIVDTKMKFWKVFSIILVLIKLTSGGGFSHCNDLEGAFVVLYTAINEIIDISEESSTDPSLGSALAFSLECKLNETVALIVEGTNRLTDMDPNYILNILTGEISQPFQRPLDCIADGLTSTRNIINFVNTVAISSLNSMYIPTILPENITCDGIEQLSAEKFGFFVMEMTQKLMDFKGVASSFASINMLDLFLNFLFNHQICTVKSLAYLAASLVNGNESEVLDYVSTLTSLSYPLNCTQSNIDISTNQLVAAYSDLLDKIITLGVTRPSPTCQKLNQAVVGLKATVFKILSRMENHTVYSLIRYPDLLPGYIENLQCTTEMIIKTIAKQLETVSQVPWINIYDILKGQYSLPLEKPLDCIQDDLIPISHRIEYVVGDFVMFLESLVLPREEPLDTCDLVEDKISSVIDDIYGFINESVAELILQNEDCSSLNGGYQFISSIVSEECEKKSLAMIFASVIGGDFNAVIDVMNGVEPADFPYSCAKNNILDALVYARQLLFNAGLYYV